MYTQPYIYHRDAGRVPFKNTFTSVTQAAQLIKQIATTPMPKDSCLGKITCALDTGAYISRGGTANSEFDLRIVPDFNMPITFKCLHRSDRDLAKTLSETEKLNTCMTCLSGGLCADWYIRNTIGRILYPLFYANKKQK